MAGAGCDGGLGGWDWCVAVGNVGGVFLSGDGLISNAKAIRGKSGTGALGHLSDCGVTDYQAKNDLLRCVNDVHGALRYLKEQRYRNVHKLGAALLVIPQMIGNMFSCPEKYLESSFSRNFGERNMS